MNRPSAQQGNPNPLGQSKARAHGTTGSESGRVTIRDRAFIERYLRTVRPECDQPESPSDDAEVRIGRGLKYPKDKGYGKFLETLAYDRNWAGMLAARIVEEGRFQAATARKNSEFAQALRRLANPRLETEAFLANAKVALEAMDDHQYAAAIAEVGNGVSRLSGLRPGARPDTAHYLRFLLR
jgi:hypothetical protein